VQRAGMAHFDSAVLRRSQMPDDPGCVGQLISLLQQPLQHPQNHFLEQRLAHGQPSHSGCYTRWLLQSRTENMLGEGTLTHASAESLVLKQSVQNLFQADSKVSLHGPEVSVLASVVDSMPAPGLDRQWEGRVAGFRVAR